MNRIFAAIFLSIYAQHAHSQTFYTLPTIFDPFYNNYLIIHPATAGMENSSNVYLGYKTQSGALSGVNTNYVGATIRSKKKDSLDLQHHGFGANVINDREGDYFARNRIYLDYALHIRLTSNWYISGGAMIGCINYNYKGTDVYPGGTVLRPTADAGLMIYKKTNTHFGITISQIIPGNLTPLESQTKIEPFISLSADKKFRLDYQTYFQGAIFYRRLLATNMYDCNINGMATFFKIISIGSTFKWNQGISMMGGFNLAVSEKNSINLYFSYFIPVSQNGNLQNPTIEFNCVLVRL